MVNIYFLSIKKKRDLFLVLLWCTNADSSEQQDHLIDISDEEYDDMIDVYRRASLRPVVLHQRASLRPIVVNEHH